MLGLTRRMSRLTPIIALAALAACAPPKIDSSSDESFESSMEKVRASLPEDRRGEFDAAVLAVAFHEMTGGSGNIFELANVPEDQIAQRARGKFDGMTAMEVIGTCRGD